MATLKPIILSLAFVSTASMALAGHFNSTVPSRIPSCFSQSAVLNRFLIGNSYAGRVRHHYLSGHHGLWMAGFAQLVGGYNSAYLLSSHTRLNYPITKNHPASGTFTLGLPYVSAMAGYDSDSLGFFVDYNYARQATYLTANKIGLTSGQFDVQEAYMTYKFNSALAVKAGKFLSDFGRYDPTNPMLSTVDFASMEVTTDGSTAAGTGVEGVFSSNGFHGSVAGMAADGFTKVVSGQITNDAKPNMLIVTGGYNSHLGSGILGFDASYASRTSNFMPGTGSAFTGDVHYTNNRWKTTAHFYHQNKALSTGKHLWVFSGDADYRFSKRFSAGGYGDYVAGTDKAIQANLFATHWIVGAKAGYALTRMTTLNAYLQHQTVVQSVSDQGVKSNTSGILALTVKV